MEIKISNKFNLQLALLVFIGVALLLTGVVAYKYWLLHEEFEVAVNDNIKLANQLSQSLDKNVNFLKEARNKQAIIDSFNGQIQSISSTVGILEKLSQTDPELLKKYSKIYFLNENYIPSKLTEVKDEYIFNAGNGNFLIHTDVWPFLKKLLDSSRISEIELLVASAFRSFDTQASLKAGYKVMYGAGTANQFSADQGYSEHQLGTSIDLTTPDTGAAFSKFYISPAFMWLEDNAYKYGFVLSYPEGNIYYKFEPWHWRFVGVELAGKIYSDSKHFYDFDQREIDTYLVKLFD